TAPPAEADRKRRTGRQAPPAATALDVDDAGGPPADAAQVERGGQETAARDRGGGRGGDADADTGGRPRPGGLRAFLAGRARTSGFLVADRPGGANNPAQ